MKKATQLNSSTELRLLLWNNVSPFLLRDMEMATMAPFPWMMIYNDEVEARVAEMTTMVEMPLRA